MARFEVVIGIVILLTDQRSAPRALVVAGTTTAAGEPINSYASTSAGADAYRSLARELLARWPAR